MENIYEIIPFSNELPAELKCQYIDSYVSTLSKDTTIIFVLDGEANIIYDGNSSLLKQDDIVLINKNTVFNISSNGATLLIFEFNINNILKTNVKRTYFLCNSSLDEDKSKYHHLIRLIARLIKDYSEHPQNIFAHLAAICQIYDELCLNFLSDNNSVSNTHKYQDRVQQITHYIDEHFEENITLSTLSNAIGLSTPYLSSFFDKYIGMNFHQYYTEYRLSKAIDELIFTDKTIEDISYSCGFNDVRSFVYSFKKKYKILPSIYRKQNRVIPIDKKSLSYDIERKHNKYENNLSAIAKYLDVKYEHSDSLKDEYLKEIKIDDIDVTSPKAQLKHNFKVFTSVSRAKELLYADVQEMLKELQKKVGFKYIKFHGILSDDMLVYKEDEYGNPTYSFVFIDKALDFILSIGLKPLIEFTFMPKDLTNANAHSVFASKFYIGEPKDYDKWADLIKNLMLHLIDRYGIREVRSWLYCAWNEPDTTTSLFGFKNDNDYYKLYKITYEIVKGFSSQCQFGSPSIIFSYKVYQDWIKKFIEYCNNNNCRPDFINIHYYDNDFTFDNISSHSPANPSHGRLNMDSESFNKAIVDIKKYMNDLGVGELPIYLTEWNLTVSHRNLLNDTVFKSCYLAKNLLENYDELDSFGYWVLTDLIEETQPSMSEFHGGLGLYTYHQIKKPHFYIFEFLNTLGNSFIDKGPGYFVAKKHGCIQIILYNYEHFNHLFASGETYDMTYLNRYTPFSNLGKMKVSLDLKGFTAKKCHIVEKIVNQKHGSAFDEWVSMSAPKIDEQIIDYLKSICIPKMNTKDEEIINGKISISATLSPLEVRLIEINY